jgi:tetratricopeptide (TPR) repeat protein
MDRWVERMERYARPDTRERVIVDYLKGVVRYTKGDNLSGHRLLSEAFNLARRIGNQDAVSLSANALLHFNEAPHDIAEMTPIAEELWAGSRDKPHGFLKWGIQINVGNIFLISGQRQCAEEVFNDLRALAERSGNLRFWIQSRCADAVLALMDGQLNEVLAITRDMMERSEQAGVSGIAGNYAYPPRVRASVYLGTSLEVREREIPPEVPLYVPELSLIKAHLGRREEVSDILEEQVMKRPDIGTDKDETRFWSDVLYLEAALLVNHRKSAKMLSGRLKGIILLTTGFRFPTCIARHLSGAAALLGKYDEARKHYQEAIKVCTEMSFRPELALSRLQLAELLLEHYPERKRKPWSIWTSPSRSSAR